MRFGEDPVGVLRVGVTEGDAFGRGRGDMWANGLFPHPCTQLAYTSKIGSFVADDGAKAGEFVGTPNESMKIPRNPSSSR